MASYTISYTYNSITFHVTGLESGQELWFYLRPDPDDHTTLVDHTITTQDASVTRTYAVAFTPYAEYACNVRVDGQWLGVKNFSAPPPPPPPITEWSWSKTPERVKAHKALINHGNIDDFSYVVWNEMISKVCEILDRIGSSWSTNYATLLETQMTSSDKVLTAKRFNSLRYNIGSRYSTGIPEVKPGDIVYGSYFITLSNCINNWIKSL